MPANIAVTLRRTDLTGACLRRVEMPYLCLLVESPDAVGQPERQARSDYIGSGGGDSLENRLAADRNPALVSISLD
jgi:hypothetical protein